MSVAEELRAADKRLEARVSDLEAHFSGTAGYYVTIANMNNRLDVLEKEKRGREKLYWAVILALVAGLIGWGFANVKETGQKVRGEKHVEHPESSR